MKAVYCVFTGLVFASVSTALATTQSTQLLWVNTNRGATTQILKQQYSGSLEIVIPPTSSKGNENPFSVSSLDFNTGNALPWPQIEGAPRKNPSPHPSIYRYFESLVSRGFLPDLFLIGGHHVISQGWHDHEEERFIFHPTLHDAVTTIPAARKVFENVKVGILWGCNTMTNLEPHGDDGSYLSPEVIKKAFAIGKEGRLRMIGSADQTNTLEFYKARLAREYGPRSPKFEYTRNASEERCRGPGKYDNCDVTNLERVLPESFLYDGEHRVNEPYRMKRLLPNAYLVLGYSSASPSEEGRAKILDQTLKAAQKDLGIREPLLPLVTAEETPYDHRIKIIEAIRKQWTIQTYRLNRGRPSGSITPALPELDRNGIFNVVVSKDTPRFAPYESRESK